MAIMVISRASSFSIDGGILFTFSPLHFYSITPHPTTTTRKRTNRVVNGHDLLLDSVPRKSKLGLTNLDEDLKLIRKIIQLRSLFRDLEALGIRSYSHSIDILIGCYCRLDPVIFTSLLNWFIHCNQLYNSNRLLREMFRLEIQSDHVTFGTMLKGLCIVCDNAGTLSLLRDMDTISLFEPNVVAYNVLVGSLCKN